MKLSLVMVLGPTIAIAIVSACANDETTPPPPDVVDAQGFQAPDAADAADAMEEQATTVDCTTTAFCDATPTVVPSFVSLNAIWGSSATDLWIVGSQGTILHGDGTTFTAMVPPVNIDGGVGSATRYFSVWGAAKDDVWIGPARAPLHYAATTDGGAPTWQVVEGSGWDDSSADQGRVAAIWGSSTSNVWMAGPVSFRFGGNSGSFWALGQTRGVYAWNELDALQADGTPLQPSIAALWGLDANTVFAVGDHGKAFRFVPAAGRVTAHFSEVDTLTTARFDAVWGKSATDVWAVGENGTIRHYGSNGFEPVSAPVTQSLHGVWGASATDIWAVGDGGTVLHYDGSAWTVETSGLAVGKTPALFAVWGTGPDDVWIGGEGVLLHRTTKNRRLP